MFLFELKDYFRKSLKKNFCYFISTMEQPKTEAILRMLVMLSSGVRYSISELSERFSITERTVYRDLNTIENAGFVLNRSEGLYSLQLCSKEAKIVNTLLHFSEEEAYLLYKAMDMVKGGAPVSDRLVRKLNVLYDFRALSKISLKPEIVTVRVINEAIIRKKQVRLCNYRSSNSETISDRIVEPFEFLPEYSAVWCFDLLDNVCKQFKISRLDEVEDVDSDWLHEDLHRVPFVDVFRMSGLEAIDTVHVELTLKAANLLREEFPLSEPFLNVKDNSIDTEKKNLKYLLSISVADFHGIGRFILGLPGEVNVIGPESFKCFLKKNKQKDL